MVQRFLVYYTLTDVHDIHTPWPDTMIFPHELTWIGFQKPRGLESLHYSHCDILQCPTTTKKECFEFLAIHLQNLCIQSKLERFTIRSSPSF